ncbi:LOW QUALITY PROTEIN: hypothetical protein N665_0323s0044 [Sinapis alba]|nr:LOW QUALITY PROTEIN: hypothetical protein N665_0323s0044 [Sinapis alba]
MKTISVLVFLLLLLLVVEARSRDQTGCEPFSICGVFPLEFPFFSTEMLSRFGLFIMNCSNKCSEIQLEEKKQWYKLKSVSEDLTDILITDPRVNQSLIAGNCSDLSNFSIPNSPWLELTTFYKCTDGGSSFVLLHLGDGHDEKRCSAFKIPKDWVDPRNKNQLKVDASFSLHINLPQGCPECYNQGGECKMITDKYIQTIIGNKARKSDWNGKNAEAAVILKRYSYAKVKKMTNSFEHVLGSGGFGIVYKGKLPDGGIDVAVKILNEGNGEDFINEITSMSRTSHVNNVSLLGFCYDGNKRAIVYEFVPNGSLDKFISENMSRKMEWIVRFNIKSQNILMDKDLCLKISDFCLAKLYKNKESVMSMLDVRGTARYIAPELLSKYVRRVSHKSDVYTRDLWRGENMRIFGDEITEEEEEKIVKKMVLVGL